MTLALYGKSRKRRGALLLTALLAVLAATLGGLALIGTAFAHTAVVTGIATCNADGTWNIAWTVNNDETSGRATYGTVALSNISVDSGTPPTLSPLTLQVFGTTGYVPATGTQSNIPGSATSVTLKVTGTWSDGQVYTDQGTVSFPSNCSKITVKKVVTGIGSSASDVFGVNIQNTGGGTGDNSNAQISQNTPYTETVAVDGSKDLFTFNENTPLPTGYALSKVAVLDGNNKTCPSSLTSSTWGNPGNPNDASKNLSAGSNVTVCFLNTYTAPTGFITISEGACTANTAGSWAFHFIAPNTSANSSDTITVKYHYNGELVDAHITTQVENGSGAKDNWHVTIPFGSFSSITIDHATDTAGDSWDGVNGLANAVIQSSLCQPEVGAPGVSKTQDATPFDATNAYWDITVNNSANNVALTGFTVTDAGTTLVSATGGTCTTVGAGSPFTCTVAAQGTVVIKVSKPLAPSGGVFDACKGVTLDNNAITVTGLPQGVPAVTTITYTNTQIVVAPDTTKCTPPTITKTGTTPTTGVPSWTILVTNPTAANDGITRKVIITDAGVTAASPVLTGGATCTNTGNITSTGITCTMPAGSTVSIKVTPASAPTRQCLDTTFNNTANLYIDSTSNTPITGVGTTITLTGDQTKCGLPTIVKGADVSETSGQPTWTINVTNPDAGQGIQRTVVVKDATASLVSTNTTSGSVVCTGTDITVAGVSCVMSAGSSVEFHVTAFPVVTQTCAPQQFTNTVSMTVDGGSPITANADNTITVTGNPALCASTTFDKTDSLGTPPTVNAGTPFTWTMKATVSGSATTAAQTFSDTIPNTFLIVSVTPNDASITCAAPVASGGDNIITCTLHSAAAVGDHTVAVNVLPGAGACGPFTNTVNDVQGAVLASDRQITVNCDQQVTFIKYICPTTSDIPANPPFGTAVTDAAGKCTRATTPWVFNLGTSDGGSQFGTATTSSTGETTITLSTAELTKALNAYPNGIHVSEVVQTGFTLGSLRCYEDHANSATDNVEILSIPASGTPGVFCIAYNIPPPFTISTAKVVCDTEAALPDHKEVPITATTAAAWVTASNSHCELAPNWQFQWGYTTGSSTVSDAGPTLIGAAGGNWSAPFSGSTQVTDLKGNTSLWVREVLPDGSWLPFSQDLTGYGEEINPLGSAELACNIDGLHYDNFDRIDNVAYGKTLYCVAFNVKKTSTVDISKTDDTHGSVAVGGTFNWKLTVTVAGYQTTKASTITDPLPAGFTTPDGAINSSPLGISCTAASNVVTCNLPSGTAIGVYTITIPTTAPANGAKVCTEYTNTATLEDQAQLVAFRDQIALTNPETYLHTTASDTVSVTGCSGTLHIVKITEGVADPHSAQFSGTIDNSQAWGPIGANGVSGPFTVSVGDHSIQEGPASQDPALWTPVGLAYANVDHVCPATPDNSLTMPHVDAGASVYVCVYNLRKEAQSTDGTIKLIKVVTGNNPDNSQPFQVQAGTNSGTLTNLGSVTYHFAFSTDNPTVAVSPVGESSVPTNYQLLGYKVFSGGILSCPAVTDNSVATTVSTVGTLTIAQQTPAYTVCIYNQPNGTISVHKTTETNGIIDTNNGGWKFTVSSVACGITNVALTTDASGNASASVPACSDYVVTENTATPPVANYTVVGSATQTGIVVPAGGIGTANFLNVRTVNSGCTNPAGCTPPPPSCTVTNTCTPPLTITTPTPTATPTTVAPTATPTKSVEKPANTPTATPSNTTNVLGEKTPGPGSTPVAPSTGSGFFGGTGGGFNAFIAALGLLALTAGFAILGVARKERRG